MIFDLEALNAAEGDCLLVHFGPADDLRHIVVDGGTRAVGALALEPRLLQLREWHGLEEDAALPIDLAVVSHVDNDHIQGILGLLEALSRGSAAPRWAVERLWCNTFDDRPQTDQLDDLRKLDPGGVASLADGRKLRDLASKLGIAKNVPDKVFKHGFVLRGGKAPRVRLRPRDALTLSVLCPTVKELRRLQGAWGKKPSARAGGVAATEVDTGIWNLSSIALLAELGQSRMLLAGDTTAAHLLEGLESSGFLPKGGTCDVDILKLPHHGSCRNASPALFERVRAAHYVISANGRYSNPDTQTLDWLWQARGDEAKSFTIWLTFRENEYKQIGRNTAHAEERRRALRDVQGWLNKHPVEVQYRRPDALGVVVALGDETLDPEA